MKPEKAGSVARAAENIRNTDRKYDQRRAEYESIDAAMQTLTDELKAVEDESRKI